MFLRTLCAFLFLSLTSFLCSKSEKITIEEGGKPFKQMVHLDRNHPNMGITIKENTLNDTALVDGILPIPPGKVGSMGRWDCFSDSMTVTYSPYLADSGRLVFVVWSSKF